MLLDESDVIFTSGNISILSARTVRCSLYTRRSRALSYINVVTAFPPPSLCCVLTMQYELPFILLVVFTSMVLVWHAILKQGTQRVRIRDPRLDKYSSAFYEFTATNSDDVDKNQLNCSKRFVPCVENGDCSRLCDPRYNTVAECRSGLCAIESSAESWVPDVVGSCGDNPFIVKARKILALGLTADVCLSLRPDLWQNNGQPAKYVCADGTLNTTLVNDTLVTTCLCPPDSTPVYFSAWPDVPQCVDRRAKHIYPEIIQDAKR